MSAKRPLGFLCIAVFSLAACSDSDSPTDPDDPGGGGLPTTTNTATIEPGGGTVALEDGTAVVFPAGAVSSPLAVTVAKTEPSTWFEGTGEQERVVVQTTASVTQFPVDVEIRVPLPAGMTPADSADVVAGVIDEATGAVTVEASSIREIDGEPFLVIETDHFSSRLVEWIFGKDPPSSALLEVPYYNQGQSPYCWAVTVHTVTQAVNFQDLRSTMDVIGEVGIDEAGITPVSYRLNSDIAGLVRRRTGVKPDRMMWDYVNKDQMRDYLWREVGVNGHPVGVFVGKWEHAVVVVGYDGATFKIHDPASVTEGSIGYREKPWSEFIHEMSINDKMVTLVVPKELSASNDRVTASWLPKAFEFTKPNYGPDEPGAIWRYGWDYQQDDGYSIRHAASGDVGDPLPGEVAELRVNGDLQLANSSLTASREVGVYVDITAPDAPDGAGRLSTYRQVTVGPNSARDIHVPAIQVDTFRYNDDDDVEYLLSAIVRVDGETVDWQTVEFTLAPVEPKLESVTPDTAAVGDEVTVKGKKLGFLAMNNAVVFNGEEADSVVSWSDDEVVVVVPEEATTGPLWLARGEVESDSLDFTVSEYTTLSGTVIRSYADEVVGGTIISVNGNWTLEAEDAELDYFVPETHHYSWYAKLGKPGELYVSFNADIAPSEIDTDNGGKIVFHPLEWTFTTDSYGSSFPWSDWGSDGSKGVSFTFNAFDDMLCIRPYFAVYGEVYNSEGDIVNERAFLNGRTVGIFCVKPSM